MVVLYLANGPETNIASLDQTLCVCVCSTAHNDKLQLLVNLLELFLWSVRQMLTSAMVLSAT